MSNTKQEVNLTNSGIYGFLLFIIITLPWFHGGEVNWQYQIFEIVIFLMFTIYAVKLIKNNNQQKSLQHLLSLKLPILLFSMFCLYSLSQSIQLPFFNNQYIENINYFNIEKQHNYISISPTHSLNEALKQLSYLAIFIVTTLVVTTHKRVITVITLLFSIAAITAIYALINYYTKGGFLYMETLPPWQASNYTTIHGPLSYKNHYASFLILTIPLGFGLMLSNKLNKSRSNLTKLLNFSLSKNIVFLLTSLFMVLVLVFNTSRGGLLSFFLGTFITIIFLMYIKRVQTNNIYKKIAALLLLIAIIILSGLSDRLFERINNYGENGRDTLRYTALQIAQDNPILGTGAGTYPAIQHMYKSENLNGNKMWQHVHNDYFELLSNQGAIGIILLGSTIILLLIRLISGIKSNKNSLFSIQVACLGSVLCVLIHSFMDFNFQLPLISVYFYIILAIGLKIPSLKRTKSSI